MNQRIMQSVHVEGRLSRELMHVIAAEDNLDEMMLAAKELNDAAHGNIISYSKNIKALLFHFKGFKRHFAIASQTAQTEKLISQNVAYRATVYITGGSAWI